MTAALEILTAERDAIAAAIASNHQYLAVCLTETAQIKKALGDNERRLADLNEAITKIN